MSQASSDDAAPNAPKRLLATAILLVGAVMIGHPAFALLLGIGLNLTLEPVLPSGLKNAGKLLLQGAIVILGLTLSAATLWSVSQDYAGIVVLYVFVALGLGLFLGRMIGTDLDQSRLLAAGTAICGGTAIATLAPVIKARADSVAVCLAIVFLLNAIAILTLPEIGHYLALTQTQFGVWVALAVHDTSSVIGTAALYGEEALEIATTVKLARTLWLIPLVLVAGVLLHRQEAKLRVPGFVLLFVAASLLGSLIELDPEWVVQLKRLSKAMLVAALFMIGMEVTRSTLRTLNARAVWLGVGLWVMVLPATLLLVLAW
ncbi:MAG: YeiH family protein [Pseudomonadales bacterium]